jgi:hypothetical protein
MILDCRQVAFEWDGVAAEKSKGAANWLRPCGLCQS